MKIKNIINVLISICILVGATQSIAEENNQVLILPPKAKQAMTKEQLAVLKKKAKSEGIVIVQEATLPAPGRLICDSWWVGTDGLLPANSWLCDTEYFCPPTMTATFVDSSSGARIDCDYDCGGQPTSGWFGGASCDCSLQSGQNSSCPQ